MSEENNSPGNLTITPLEYVKQLYVMVHESLKSIRETQNRVEDLHQKVGEMFLTAVTSCRHRTHSSDGDENFRKLCEDSTTNEKGTPNPSTLGTEKTTTELSSPRVTKRRKRTVPSSTRKHYTRPRKPHNSLSNTQILQLPALLTLMGPKDGVPRYAVVTKFRMTEKYRKHEFQAFLCQKDYIPMSPVIESPTTLSEMIHKDFASERPVFLENRIPYTNVKILMRDAQEGHYPGRKRAAYHGMLFQRSLNKWVKLKMLKSLLIDEVIEVESHDIADLPEVDV
jgi:hypothetical protein